MSTVTAPQPRTSQQAAPRTDAHRVPSRLRRYTDHRSGATREIVSLPGAGGSRLVVDRDALTRGDQRLVAHLAGDEPPENARLVTAEYIADEDRGNCRLARLPPQADGGARGANHRGVAPAAGRDLPARTGFLPRRERTFFQRPGRNVKRSHVPDDAEDRRVPGP